MEVKELIKKLETLDQEKEIHYIDGMWDNIHERAFQEIREI